MTSPPASTETADPAVLPLTAALESQNIKPGDEGWWKVWGARAYDIEPGDLLALKWSDTGYHEFAITDVPAREGMADECAPRFVTASGKTIRVGMAKPIVLLRRGTHNTLARNVR